MEIIKTTLETVGQLVPEVLQSKQEAAIYCVADANCAVVGSNGGSNLDAIKQSGVQLVQIQHEGGTIVLSPGDVDVGIYTHGYRGHEYRDQIIDGLVALVKEHCDRVEVVDNDVLVEGKKVAGFGSRMFGEILYTAIHISVGMDLDLIKVICTKPMVKEPIGLDSYGITTDEVLNIIFSVLESE